MRLAMIGKSFPTLIGGIEFHQTQLAAELRHLGHEVEEFAQLPSRISSATTFDWVVYEGIHRRNLLIGTILKPFPAKRTAVFTHGSFYETGHIAELRRIGYPYSPMSFWSRRLFDTFLMPTILGGTNLIITLAPQESTDIMNLFTGLSTPIESLPNFWAGPASDSPEPVVPELSSFKPYIVAVSRVDPRKNLAAVVQAIDGLRVNLVLAGPDGGALPSLTREVARLGSSNFRYLGPVDEVTKRSLIENSSALILPSFFEGASFAALEALAMGKPVISTSRSYLGEMSRVFLCSPEPGSIRTTIEHVLNLKELPVAPKVPSANETAVTFLKLLDAAE
jgi:glycosyltransferase involved in cell wall biosynthesis